MRFWSLNLVSLGCVFMALLLSFTAGYGSAAGDAHANPRTASSDQGSWVVQSSGAKENLYSVSAPTERSAWAVGSFGTILHTADGQSWNAQTAGDGYHYQGFMQTAFPDERHGWIAYRGLGLLHTADGGATWSLQDDGIPVMRRWDTVTAFDASHAWSGTNSDVRRTSDAGATWLSGTLSLPIESPVKSLAFPTAVEGWAASSFDITHTSDGGATWVQQLHHDAGGGSHWVFKAISFTDALHGWAVGLNGLIIHTEDGGEHWAQQDSGTTATLMGVCFLDAVNGWAVGNKGTILRTVDGGVTWRSEASGTTEALWSIDMVDSSHGWAVGLLGTIVRYQGGQVRPAISSISPTSAAAGTGDTITLSGSGFGAREPGSRVNFTYQPVNWNGSKSAVKWVSAEGTDIVSWTESSIVCKVPCRIVGRVVESASSGPVTVTAASGATSSGRQLLVTYGVLWKWATPTCSYSLDFPSKSGRSAITAAAQTWTATGHFAFTYAKSSANHVYVGQPREEDAVAIMTPVLTKAPLEWRMLQIKSFAITFDVDRKWITAESAFTYNRYDVRTIALHELGHALGLADLYGAADRSKVMYGGADKSGFQAKRKWGLSSSDQAGIAALYPTDGVPPRSRPTNTSTAWQSRPCRDGAEAPREPGASSAPAPRRPAPSS